MKPAQVTWPEHLAHGVRLMEGAELTPPWKGGRWLPEAASIFEECARNCSDSTIKTEAYFRMGQVCLYQGDAASADLYFKGCAGSVALAVPSLPADTKAQCLLIKASDALREKRYEEAKEMVGDAWEIASRDNHKLFGDILTLHGRIAEETGDLHQAIHEIGGGVGDYEMLEPLGLSLVDHALASAKSHLGWLVQRTNGYDNPFTNECFAAAERLFSSGRVADPCIRGQHWRWRASQAFRSGRVLAGLVFTFRAVGPSLACWWYRRRK